MASAEQTVKESVKIIQNGVRHITFDRFICFILTVKQSAALAVGGLCFEGTTTKSRQLF